LLGIFYGVLAIMVFYKLILFFFSQERTYLYYVLYVLGGTATFVRRRPGVQYWSGPGIQLML
jgi:hypothetical protein